MLNLGRHGVMTPNRRPVPAPARAMNAKSRKKEATSRIRLDKLLRSANPQICIKRRLGGIGDVLMTTPITKAIKELIPRCRLVYATDLKYSNGALGDIIRHNPYVDELVAADHVPEEKYDYVVDITTTGLDKERSGTVPPNRIDMFASAVGVDVAGDPLPVYEVTSSEHVWASNFIRETIPGYTPDSTKIIVIQARSNDARRTWPLEHTEALVYLLSSEPDLHIFLMDWGHTVSRWKAESPNVHLFMDRPITEVAALVQQCDVVVCPDSAILHLAGALQKKIVTIFGPIPPASRINYYANATAITKNLPCQYCWYSPKCVKGSDNNKLDCLTKIMPQEVKEAVMGKLVEPYKVSTDIVYGQTLTDKNQDSIIMIRRTTAGIGDLLMATPAIEAMARMYPEMKIEVACKKELWPVLLNNPHVDKIMDCDEPYNPRRYYMIADISAPCARYESARVNSGKAVQKSRVEIYAEACGVRDLVTDLKPKYYMTKEESDWAADFLSKTSIKPGKPLLAVGMRSAEQYRDWPEEGLQELFTKLEPYTNIILLDHSRKHTYTNVIDAAGFDLRKAIAILSKCNYLLSVDTSLIHFAAALGIPMTTIFGPIDYKPRCKGYSGVTVIKSDMQCIPCWRNSKIACRASGLIKGYSKCMEAVPAGKIAQVVIQKLKELPNANS